MLDGLDRIDWAGLGNAEAVPDHLQGLMHRVHAQRQSSHDTLQHYLVRSGRLTAAASPAIPFLVAIAASAPRGRGYAALLLCLVACTARATHDEAVRAVLEAQRDAIRTWSGTGVIDARAYLLSCLDRFSFVEHRAEQRVLRKLQDVLGEMEAQQ